MFWIVRAGARGMARSGGPRQGPPREWPPLGKLIFGVLFIGTWCEINWHSCVIALSILAGITLIAGLAGAGRPQAPARDKLEDLMDDYARKEGKP